MKIREFLPPDEAMMRSLGESLAAGFKPGDVITLSGPLGAGKTTLAQGIAVGLGIALPITSPTYVLLNEYPGAPALLHLDAYRLEEADEATLRDAGIDEALARPDAVKLIEWPEMILPWLRDVKWTIVIEPGPAGGRRVEVREF